MRRSFILQILLALIFFISIAHAENALETWGKAEQQYYFGVKNLGLNPQPSQIAAVRDKVFAPAKEAFRKELDEIPQKYERLATRTLLDMVKKDLLPNLSKAGGYKDIDAKEKDLSPSDTTDTAVSSPSSETRPRDTTGEFEGSSGAKKIDFDKGRKRSTKTQPTVGDDGIIQSR